MHLSNVRPRNGVGRISSRRSRVPHYDYLSVPHGSGTERQSSRAEIGFSGPTKGSPRRPFRRVGPPRPTGMYSQPTTPDEKRIKSIQNVSPPSCSPLQRRPGAAALTPAATRPARGCAGRAGAVRVGPGGPGASRCAQQGARARIEADFGVRRRAAGEAPRASHKMDSTTHVRAEAAARALFAGAARVCACPRVRRGSLRRVVSRLRLLRRSHVL